jgi:hypothetical protein
MMNYDKAFVDFYCRFNLFCLFETEANPEEVAVNQERVDMGIPSIYDEGDEPTVRYDMNWTLNFNR